MKKIGISTVYTGYNYGSALQAFAVKTICTKLGYSGEVLHLRGSLIPGRDVRIGKALMITLRMLCCFQKGIKSIKAYAGALAKTTPKEVQPIFDAFIAEYIKPVTTSWYGLKILGKREEYVSFICGSDQIWNADVLYVDPQYYLRYAPQYKRIAYAPSFGRHCIPDYNKQIIGKYVSQIPYLSVREDTGISIIKEIADRESVCLLDPTLYFNRSEWIELLQLKLQPPKTPYVLAYFLDEPSEQAKFYIRKISETRNWKVVCLPYTQVNSDWFDCSEIAGPIEFIRLLANANFVCTDSFHGTAFSVNMQVPFYTFERQYRAASKQSARIESLLDLVNLRHRYCPMGNELELTIDFKVCEEILNTEKERTNNYLLSALEDIKNHNGDK